MTGKLTPKQERFCQVYVETGNASEAHRQAGYGPNMSDKTRNEAASRLLANGKIVARISDLAKATAQRTELSVEQVLIEMMDHAFYDATEALEWRDGELTMKNPTSLPENLRRAIVSVKCIEKGGRQYFDYKFVDKQKALNDLARHLQMFKDTVVVENVFRVVQDMDDEELDRRLADLERTLADNAILH